MAGGSSGLVARASTCIGRHGVAHGDARQATMAGALATVYPDDADAHHPSGSRIACSARTRRSITRWCSAAPGHRQGHAARAGQARRRAVEFRRGRRRSICSGGSTAFVKSVILRVNEARDLGDVDRYAFYDHMKAYTAAPPDVLRVDEKNLREYTGAGMCCGVVITTNHKTDGIYLPADDRRHYVAWSHAGPRTTSRRLLGETCTRWYDRGRHRPRRRLSRDAGPLGLRPEGARRRRPTPSGTSSTPAARPRMRSSPTCWPRLPERPEAVTTIAMIAEKASRGFSGVASATAGTVARFHIGSKSVGYVAVRNPSRGMDYGASTGVGWWSMRGRSCPSGTS